MFEDMYPQIYNMLWEFFIKYKKVQVEEFQEYSIYYKELWGQKKILEVKPRYFR